MTYSQDGRLFLPAGALTSGRHLQLGPPPAPSPMSICTPSDAATTAWRTLICPPAPSRPHTQSSGGASHTPSSSATPTHIATPHHVVTPAWALAGNSPMSVGTPSHVASTAWRTSVCPGAPLPARRPAVQSYGTSSTPVAAARLWGGRPTLSTPSSRESRLSSDTIRDLALRFVSQSNTPRAGQHLQLPLSFRTDTPSSAQGFGQLSLEPGRQGLFSGLSSGGSTPSGTSTLGLNTAFLAGTPRNGSKGTPRNGSKPLAAGAATPPNSRLGGFCPHPLSPFCMDNEEEDLSPVAKDGEEEVDAICTPLSSITPIAATKEAFSPVTASPPRSGYGSPMSFGEPAPFGSGGKECAEEETKLDLSSSLTHSQAMVATPSPTQWLDIPEDYKENEGAAPYNQIGMESMSAPLMADWARHAGA